VTPAAELRLELQQLYADYAACLDDGRMSDWPGFFIEDCHYRLVPRENHERGLPLATMDLRGRAMLEDRVYGVTSTLFHAPYYQRHVIGPIRLLEPDGETIRAEASYLVLRTKRDQLTEVFNAGRYVDRVARTDDGLKFAAKVCVFDTELILNSIIYPI
jgi:salicylate 5-hydroxylase small subunit